MRKSTGSALSSDSIIEFFDQRAADYDREYHLPTPGGYALRIRRKKVLDLFDKPGGDVLDVGCGPAVMTNELLARGCKFWGVDPSSKMIEICRKRFPECDSVHFLQGDALHLNLPSGFFDAVLCMGVIDSLRDGRRGIQEMVRVLKPGGTLILTFTNLYSPYAWWKNYVFYPLVAKWQQWRTDRGARQPGRRSADRRGLYSRRRACCLLESEGTQVLQVANYYYNLALAPLDEIAPSTALWLTRALEEGPLPKPGWAASGLIVKARKAGL
jgi:ubiquinone/menaquinone biosynthesis C-methylase UbiE